jgi:hypothetical protein
MICAAAGGFVGVGMNTLSADRNSANRFLSARRFIPAGFEAALSVVIVHLLNGVAVVLLTTKSIVG